MTRDTNKQRLYAVCKNEREARTFQQDQRERLRHRGLHRLYAIEIQPVSHTRDGFPNVLGEWGVYLTSRID